MSGQPPKLPQRLRNPCSACGRPMAPADRALEGRVHALEARMYVRSLLAVMAATAFGTLALCLLVELNQ